VFPCDGFYSLVAPLPDSCLETIDTDRPHQTDTPHTVPAGHAQFESAVGALQLGGTLDGSDPKTHLALLEDNYKFGLFSRVDLQLIFKHADYVLDDAHFDAPGPLNVRVKINFLKENGAIPAMTLVPTIFVPMSHRDPLRGGALVFWGWDLPLGFELEMNAGILAQDRSPHALLVLASAITHKVVGPFSAFADVYATGFDVQLGFGALAPIGRDVQIDFGTYVGVTGAVYVATPFIGFSFRR